MPFFSESNPRRRWLLTLLSSLALTAAAAGGLYALHDGEVVRFDRPWMLWLLFLAVPIVLLGISSLDALDPPRRWTSIAFRLIVLVLLVGVLTGVQWTRRHDDMALIVLADRSESVRLFYQPPVEDGREPRKLDSWLSDWIATARDAKRRGDFLGVVSFDGRSMLTSAALREPAVNVGRDLPPVEGTDMATAIRYAASHFPANAGKRMVMLTDGNDTFSSGEVVKAVREAASKGIRIDFVPLDYQVSNEVIVESVSAPIDARKDQTIKVTVTLSSTRPVAGRLAVEQNGYELDLDPDPGQMHAPVAPGKWIKQEGVQSKYLYTHSIEIPLSDAGRNDFAATFHPSGAGLDRTAANNTGHAFTLVQGMGEILVVDSEAADKGTYLVNALRDMNTQVTTVGVKGMPVNSAEMSKFDAIILQNVPRDNVDDAVQREMQRYVNDMGGGLIMVGGPDSFAAGGWAGSPIDKILPVECHLPSQRVMPSGALVIVLDHSGSMMDVPTGARYNKQEIANEAAARAIQTLFPHDLVGVVAFDHTAKWVVKLAPNSRPGRTAQLVKSIVPQGGTNIYSGLIEAYNGLRPITPDQAAVKHVILLTDGQDGGNVHQQFFNLARQMNNAQITVSTIGVGDGADHALLTQIAKMGKGKYYYISDPNKLPQVFIKEARTVRKNLIKEKKFVPSTYASSPVTAGVPRPSLHGLVLTGPKKNPDVTLAWVGPEGEPVLAHWQVGLGRVAAFTSDATSRWAKEWVGSESYRGFWKALTDQTARAAPNRAFDLLTTIDRDRLKVRLNAYTGPQGESGRAFAADMEVFGYVYMPERPHEQGADGGGRKQAERFLRLHQTEPGVYVSNEVPAKESGNYIVTLSVRDREGNRYTVYGGTSRPPGGELRNFQTNEALIQRLARESGGQVLSARADNLQALFRHDEDFSAVSMKPMWRHLLILALILFFFDVACRRVAWSYGGMAAVVGHWWAALTARRAPVEQEATATLSALKRRAAEVERRLGAASADAGAGQSQAVGSAPAPDAGAKFEADVDLEPDEDFATAVGAATTQERGQFHYERSTSEEDGQTTSRLLDAKRRARQRMRNDESNDPQ